MKSMCYNIEYMYYIVLQVRNIIYYKGIYNYNWRGIMKKFKKVTSILLATMITLSYSPRIEVFANDKEGLLGNERKSQITGVDVTKPVLDVSSLKVDKKEVKPGDRVKISFKATDDMSGIDEENVAIH